MAELDELRERELVRDELFVLQVPQRLASIEATLEHKADKADIENLRGEIKSLDKRLTGEIKALDERLSGKIDTLTVEQKLTRDFIKTNTRILIGIAIAILILLIKDSFFK